MPQASKLECLSVTLEKNNTRADISHAAKHFILYLEGKCFVKNVLGFLALRHQKM